MAMKINSSSFYEGIRPFLSLFLSKWWRQIRRLAPRASADAHVIIEKLNTVGGSPFEAVAQRPSLIRQLQHYAEHPEECEAGLPEYIQEFFRQR
jgi:hypothetical protein